MSLFYNYNVKQICLIFIESENVLQHNEEAGGDLGWVNALFLPCICVIWG